MSTQADTDIDTSIDNAPDHHTVTRGPGIEHRQDPLGGAKVVTHTCTACGAKRGEDFGYLPSHIATDHQPSDFGLEPLWEGNGDG